jgi:SAM-dependent methyltransferase
MADHEHLSSDELFGLEVLRGAVGYQRWVIASFGPRLRGRVLEVGAGNGNFTRHIAPIAQEVVALEPVPELRAEVDALALPHVITSAERLEDLDERIGLFDSVVMINVLEHIIDDGRALLQASERLRRGGGLFILVPAHKLLFGQLDRSFGHHRRYSRAEVGALVRGSGLASARLDYFNPVGAVGWLWVGRVMKRSRIDEDSVKLSEKVGVPAGKLLESLMRPPFGQSVLAVAIRRDGAPDGRNEAGTRASTDDRDSS